MKNHLATIILLLLAAVVFVLQFFVKDCLRVYCDIVAFAFPSIAAIVEIVVDERASKETKQQIKKLKDNQLSVRVEGEALIFDQGEKNNWNITAPSHKWLAPLEPSAKEAEQPNARQAGIRL